MKLKIDEDSSAKIKKLIFAFFFVLIFITSLVALSVDTVKKLSEKTEALIKSDIPELQKIADAQNILNNIIINLQQYYATLDRLHYEINPLLILELKNQIVLIKKHDTENIINKAVLMDLQQFEAYSESFDIEMSLGKDRDWEKLRELLYKAQHESDNLILKLSNYSNRTRKNVSNTSALTLKKITTINRLQIGFNIGLLFVFLFIFLHLYRRIKDQKELYHLAYHSAVTNLPNRRYLEESLTERLSESPNDTFTLIHLNLDRFKFVTSSFGHQIGDELLVASSQWLCETLKKQNCPFEIYQFTNTSWLILLTTGSVIKTSSEIANELLTMSSTPMKLTDIKVTTSCSIGVCFNSTNEISVTELLSNVDTALRSAMQAGGNCFKYYSEEMRIETKEWIKTDNNLRYAIQKNEFELFYQPKINFRNDKIESSEALLRWKYDGIYISPGNFIPIAESSGLILKIGAWVLTEACQQWCEWQKQNLCPKPIAVNVSSLQFQEPSFPQQVRSILEKTDMPPSMLELEITEEAATNDPERVVSIMHELKKIGVSLAIDDFGTGYSSLSQLSKFPVDVLKVDQSFVRKMETSDRDASIVKLIIDLTKELNFKVVVEGVETETQYQRLKHWDCDLAQGFLFSRPVPANEFITLIQEQQAHPSHLKLVN